MAFRFREGRLFEPAGNIDPDGGDEQIAGIGLAVGIQKTNLRGDKGNRGRGDNRRAHGISRVAIQAGGNIDRKNFQIRFVEGIKDPIVRRTDQTGKSGPEKGVNDKSVGATVNQDCFGDILDRRRIAFNNGGVHAIQNGQMGQGIPRNPLTRSTQDDGSRNLTADQVTGNHKAIPAVVSGPAEDHNIRVMMILQVIQDPASGVSAGVLHQNRSGNGHRFHGPCIKRSDLFSRQNPILIGLLSFKSSHTNDSIRKKASGQLTDAFDADTLLSLSYANLILDISMHILLTNDDGIFAPGLSALYRRLSGMGRVTVVAPSEIRSGAGHSITLTPITCETVEIMGHFTGLSVDGTPGDCVKLALHKLLDTRRTPVDLVVSGINHGSNLGVHVFYSGTVAAAVEGAFNGIPSIAVSAALDEPMDMEAVADRAVEVIRSLLPLASGPVININIPKLSRGAPKGIRVIPHATSGYRERYIEGNTPSGQRTFQFSDDLPRDPEMDRETDVRYLSEGYITLSALSIHRNDLRRNRQLRLRLDGQPHPAEPEIPSGGKHGQTA